MTDAPAQAGRRLLVVIPCLNEEAHLPTLLPALARDPLAKDARIVVADGGSRDGSAAIVEAMAASDPRFALLHNPKRIQSAAVNLAAERFGAGAEYLIRVDAHAGYPEDYFSKLVEACESSDADSVTVAMIAKSHGGGCFQVAAAAAQNSKLGTGGSAHRAAGGRRWVDHGHHALFKLETFKRVGGYDESFSHNEDAELDARLTDAGGRILLAADIVIDYYPRSAARALARQYFKFGQGRARTIAVRRKVPKLRQLAPLGVAPAVLIVALAPLTPWAVLPAAAWLVLCLGFGALLGLKERRWCAALAGVPAAIMHLAWSAGFWTQTPLLRRALLGGKVDTAAR
jgi:succinoglycan biosynthesis protein ExoA